MLSSVNAVISTNERIEFITGHMTYNTAYTQKSYRRKPPRTILPQHEYEQSKIHIHICSVVEHYEKRIKILRGCPFKGLSYQGVANFANQPISAKKGGMAEPC